MTAPDKTARWTDQTIELIVGRLLRAGVLSSAGVVAIGAVLFLIQGNGHTDYGVFHGAGLLTSIPAIWTAAIHLEARGVIAVGLLLLILTPVARVAFSALAFAMERDWLYVAITLGVLGVLLWSLLGQK